MPTSASDDSNLGSDSGTSRHDGKRGAGAVPVTRG